MNNCYVHISPNTRHADHKMHEFEKFLRFSAGFAVSRPARLIKTDELTHIFKIPDALTEHRLDGLNIVGCSIEFDVVLTPRQIDYLNSRIRA